MSLFKQSTAIGLEIDTEIIRVVELKGTPKNAVLTAIDQIKIPEDAVIEGTVNDADAVGFALEELWAKASLKKRDVVLGLLNQGVLMRMAKLPKIPEKKLAQAIRFQAEEYFPIPIAEMVLDYSVVSETEANNSEMEVLLVAARREMLNKSLKALDYGNISPVIIEPCNLATMHTLTEGQVTGNVVLLDISNGLCSLLLINDGVPRFSRVLPHSMKTYHDEENELPQADSPLAMASVAAAAEGRETFANNEGDNKLSHWGLALVNDVRASISYYISQTRTGSVDRIFLSGQGARVDGLTEILQEELEVPVKIIDPMTKVSKIAGVPGINLEQEGTDFAVAVGLALRGLEGYG